MDAGGFLQNPTVFLQEHIKIGLRVDFSQTEGLFCKIADDGYTGRSTPCFSITSKRACALQRDKKKGFVRDQFSRGTSDEMHDGQPCRSPPSELFAAVVHSFSPSTS